MVDEATRQRFVRALSEAGELSGLEDTSRVLEAFATVPRERFAGPGPWTLLTMVAGKGLQRQRTPDDDPRHLYQPILIALDEAAGINIGEPTLWARILSRLVVPEGSRVLQVGAGSGYYSAILAELVGPEGEVIAYETDARLAAMGRDSLSDRANVQVRHDNAAVVRADDGPFDLIVAFAGVTHPVLGWCEALASTGRMLLPVTGSVGFGTIGLFESNPDGFGVTTWGPCGFYPCHGARDPAVEHQLDRLFADRALLSDAKLHGRWSDGGFAYEKS